MAEITLPWQSDPHRRRAPWRRRAGPGVQPTGSDLGDVSKDAYAGPPRPSSTSFPRSTRRWCAASVRTFNERVADSGIAVRASPSDLPFAAGRFCGAEGIENVKPASTFRSSFGADYGVTIGWTARRAARPSVVVVDGEGNVAYTELVPEIAQEPNYDAALERPRRATRLTPTLGASVSPASGCRRLGSERTAPARVRRLPAFD